MLGIRALFNLFARPRGPRPEPIKIDPAWFPVAQAVAPVEARDWTPPWLQDAPPEPSWEPPWMQAFESPPEPEYSPEPCPEPDCPEDCPLENDPHDYDPVAFAEDYPDWDEEPSEPEPHIYVHPGERIPADAGELLRTYYRVGVGDVRIYERLHPDEMELDPDQIVERGELRRSFNLHIRPKGPKKPS